MPVEHLSHSPSTARAAAAWLFTWFGKPGATRSKSCNCSLAKRGGALGVFSLVFFCFSSAFVGFVGFYRCFVF